MYDEAYRKNPHDASLVSRIGQAYVKTHQYAKVRLGWVGRGEEGQPSRENGGGCVGGNIWTGGEWLSVPSSSLLNGVRGGELGSSLPPAIPAQAEAQALPAGRAFSS